MHTRTEQLVSKVKASAYILTDFPTYIYPSRQAGKETDMHPNKQNEHTDLWPEGVSVGGPTDGRADSCNKAS